MKNIIYMVGCLLIGFTTIIALQIYSHQNKTHKNNFERFFLSSDLLQNKQVFYMQYRGQYIANITKERILLGNYETPNRLMAVKFSLTEIQSVSLNIPDAQLSAAKSEELSARAVKIIVDSTKLFIVDKITPTLIYGELPGTQYTNLDNLYFNDAIALPPFSFIIRTYDAKIQQSFLHKVSKYSGSIKTTSFTLEKQVDGLFCTFGTILYSRELNEIIYVYQYRNQFVGLDTTLNILYYGNTIDTTRYANIKTQRVPSENRTVLSRYTPKVNKHCTVYGNQLFIHSGLKADNEIKDLFEKNSVIDVYSLKNQKYQFSFYIPDHNGQPITDFKVINNKIVALYDHYVVTYTINETKNIIKNDVLLE